VENIIRRATDPTGGRIVDVKRAAKGYFQALENIFKLVERYQVVDGFSYSVVDNSGETPSLMESDDLRTKRYPSIDALEQEGYSAVGDYFAAFQASDKSLTTELYQRLQGQ
jgi:hypothetical protein